MPRLEDPCLKKILLNIDMAAIQPLRTQDRRLNCKLQPERLRHGLWLPRRAVIASNAILKSSTANRAGSEDEVFEIEIHFIDE